MEELWYTWKRSMNYKTLIIQILINVIICWQIAEVLLMWRLLKLKNKKPSWSLNWPVLIYIAKTWNLCGTGGGKNFSGSFKDSSHSSCQLVFLCICLSSEGHWTEVEFRRMGRVVFRRISGSLNAGLEEKPQELVTAIQCAFPLGISGLCGVDQPSPPKQNFPCDLAWLVHLW